MSHGMCKAVGSLLVLIAGLSILAAGMGWWLGTTPWIAAGALFALVGLGHLVHAAGMCKACKEQGTSTRRGR